MICPFSSTAIARARYRRNSESRIEQPDKSNLPRACLCQSYVEFDLEAMMAGEAYPDFVLLWLLLHQSRFEAERPQDCQLEKWSKAARTEGVRVLDGLGIKVRDLVWDI